MFAADNPSIKTTYNPIRHANMLKVPIISPPALKLKQQQQRSTSSRPIVYYWKPNEKVIFIEEGENDRNYIVGNVNIYMNALVYIYLHFWCVFPVRKRYKAKSYFFNPEWNVSNNLTREQKTPFSQCKSLFSCWCSIGVANITTESFPQLRQ